MTSFCRIQFHWQGNCRFIQWPDALGVTLEVSRIPLAPFLKGVKMRVGHWKAEA